MQGFLLELLTKDGWHRDGETYWTLADATETANRILQRQLAKRVRVLPVEVDLKAVADLPETEVARA